MKKFNLIPLLLVFLLLTGCSEKEYENGELNVLNWSSYIPINIINDFEKQEKIKVNYGTYSSNEELLAKITSAKDGTYDLIFPSDYMVELMIGRNMLKEINKEKIPNYKNISDIFLNQEYDKENNYSLPFLGATTVIAVNRDNIKENITGYNDLLNDKYRNNIVLIDDQRIVLGMALQALGKDMNSTDKNDLVEASIWMKKINKNIKAFDSDSPKNFLITGETDIGVIWNAEAILAKQENNNIEIIYPKEGHAISVDNYAITSGAKNTLNAYKFINYLLDYGVNRKITESYPYLSTNNLYEDYSYGEMKKIVSTGTYVKNIGEYISMYDETWARVK